ncbi:MAG TPA: divalent metal cation transporter [Opitutaceae bacterium]|nr:divalent metal cation transporter [Opitutaceae bacterium]
MDSPTPSNSDPTSKENALLDQAANGGALQKAAIYTRLSGPGWLQGAITLGGGSLAGALYVGIISGYQLMWLQPLAMILGVIMLSAIGYVTLSTGRRPFESINSCISPVLGWAWLIATVMANIVWAMPQFSLGIGAIQQNLLPSLGGSGNVTQISTPVIALVFFIVGMLINSSYESGSKGVKIFENILKAMVAVIVVSFFLVVGVLTFSGSISWGEIFKGAIPRIADLYNPAEGYVASIAATGEFAAHWSQLIIDRQRDIIITAFGTAVGINMTFLLPYSMLRRKWGKRHRGLAIYDLSIGLIVPFVLATSCIVIAAAASFYAKTGDILNPDGTPIPASANSYYSAFQSHPRVVEAVRAVMAPADLNAARRSAVDALPEADRKLGAMLAQRGNLQLASTLTPLTGPIIAQKVFGLGVAGMAVSTIIVLMLMNGFAFCEMFGRPGHRTIHMLGCAVSGLGGFAGAFLWSNPDARAALALPTSVIGGSMIPIAYFTFFLMMNSRPLLGESMPTGGRRLWWNLLMITATTIVTCGSIWVLSAKGVPGYIGIGILGILFLLGLAGFLTRNRMPAHVRSSR